MTFLLSIFMFLAQAPAVPVAPAAADTSGSIITGFVVAVVGAIGAAWSHSQGKARGRAESVRIDGQPLRVSLEQEFVTRREFEKFEASAARDVMEMKGLFTQTMQAIQLRDEAQGKKIERLGERQARDLLASNKSHGESQGRAYNRINQQGEVLAALVARVNISDDIRGLAEAIKGNLTHEDDGK